MVGNVNEDHAHMDIDNAKRMGIDAFALNIGDPRTDFVKTTMDRMFDYANVGSITPISFSRRFDVFI